MSPVPYGTFQRELRRERRRWLVTGGAGFIGSHLVATLLGLDQEVVSLDDLSTGHLSNLNSARAPLPAEQADQLTILEGDLAEIETCREACVGIDHLLHQGALGSVPWSIEDPVATHRANVTGTLNLFAAARDAGIQRVVYASSSAVYGDDATLPKREDTIGRPLSPYAATKAIAEVYAEAFSQTYGMEFAGMRYFNVFGPRQDPSGPYAAVIPIWIASMLRGEPIYINGDGETSRDFIFVADVVQANLRAALSPALSTARARVYNVASGTQITLTRLFDAIREAVTKHRPDLQIPDPVYRDFRAGDIRHSHADFSRARDELGFVPSHDLSSGLELAMPFYLETARATVATDD